MLNPNGKSHCDIEDGLLLQRILKPLFRADLLEKIWKKGKNWRMLQKSLQNSVGGVVFLLNMQLY